MRNIAIIGGGASGIAAAITAAEAGASVTLFEEGKRIGRTILASGNGRCNWSNSQVKAQDYNNPAFVGRVFEACPPQRVWEWFDRLGLLWAEESGRMYPQANKASSVLDVLRFRLDELGVRVACERPVIRVRPALPGGGQDTRWAIDFEGGRTEHYDAVLVACGGSIARSLLPDEYRFVKRRPRLCPIRTDRDSVKGLDNIRVKGEASLLRGADIVAKERGEIQFRSFGISGIGVFNLSRHAQAGDVVRLDFLPQISEIMLVDNLVKRKERFPRRSAEQLLTGVVLPPVARAALRQAGLDAAETLPVERMVDIARRLKRYEVRVERFEEKSAQVTQGGVELAQVRPATMESYRDAGLFIMGEALDIDGPCGGYNLHWAWTCGILAGAAAANR
jgi:predicted Rossmann fold flavoprotein